jgi:hypothetical protein
VGVAVDRTSCSWLPLRCSLLGQERADHFKELVRGERLGKRWPICRKPRQSRWADVEHRQTGKLPSNFSSQTRCVSTCPGCIENQQFDIRQFAAEFVGCSTVVGLKHAITAHPKEARYRNQ